MYRPYAAEAFMATDRLGGQRPRYLAGSFVNGRVSGPHGGGVYPISRGDSASALSSWRYQSLRFLFGCDHARTNPSATSVSAWSVAIRRHDRGAPWHGMACDRPTMTASMPGRRARPPATARSRWDGSWSESGHPNPFAPQRKFRRVVVWVLGDQGDGLWFMGLSDWEYETQEDGL